MHRPRAGFRLSLSTGPEEGIILDRAIDSVCHRARLQPEFRLNDVHTSADHPIGPRGGGVAPIISHQAVGYALAGAKMAIEAVRSLIAWIQCITIGLAVIDSNLRV